MHTFKSTIAYDILNYLIRNPDACDSLKGIIDWWLGDQHGYLEAGEVKEALDELVEQGLVLELTGRAHENHYRINQHRYKQILAIFKDKRSKPAE